ncbi:MAG: hypothetical protein Q8Q08_06930 [Candidatus Omnitrophota bacterium]|nr:hypothetical protein [Candidatus Omnitrophota bacterium]MDZ4242835.1 hypothetical protein [Candidatus Omnitrophota bacterium]
MEDAEDASYRETEESTTTVESEETTTTKEGSGGIGGESLNLAGNILAFPFRLVAGVIEAIF